MDALNFKTIDVAAKNHLAFVFLIETENQIFIQFKKKIVCFSSCAIDTNNKKSIGMVLQMLFAKINAKRF